jgi:hypothetical protein
MQFTMSVKDIFNFQDGRKVFVGPITGNERMVRACKCGVYINGEKIFSIDVEGEMLPGNKKTNLGLRAISTTDNIDVSLMPFKTAKIELICE